MKLLKLPTGTSYYSEEKILSSDTLGTFVTIRDLVEDVQKELEELKKEFVEKQNLEGTKAKEAAYQEALTLLNQHILSLGAQVDNLRTHLLKQILPLALNAAKKIVGEQLKLDPATIVSMLQKQLVQCASCKKVKLLVSKEDKLILDENRSLLKEKLDQAEALVIEVSPDISPGSCVIVTDVGTIDATLERQWEALEAAFKRFSQQS